MSRKWSMVAYIFGFLMVKESLHLTMFKWEGWAFVGGVELLLIGFTEMWKSW